MTELEESFGVLIRILLKRLASYDACSWFVSAMRSLQWLSTLVSQKWKKTSWAKLAKRQAGDFCMTAGRLHLKSQSCVHAFSRIRVGLKRIKKQGSSKKQLLYDMIHLIIFFCWIFLTISRQVLCFKRDFNLLGRKSCLAQVVEHTTTVSWVPSSWEHCSFCF